MKTKYTKSSCCLTKIYRFGKKRRQCSCCKRTWTIRPKRRGRPIIRISPNVLNQIFLEKYTLLHLAKRRPGVGIYNLRHRFRRELSRFIALPSPQKIPHGELTLLADGLWFNFHNKPWVLYLTALKSSSNKTAVQRGSK